MGLIAVLAAAFAAFMVGFVWYMTFAKRWRVAAGIADCDDGDSAQAPSPSILLINFVLLLSVAGMMRHILAMSGVDGMGGGLIAGGGIGWFLISPWLGINYLYAKRPKDLWWIDCGYAVLGCAAMGAVLGVF